MNQLIREWEKYVSYTSKRGLIYKIFYTKNSKKYQELQRNQTTTTLNNPNHKWVNELTGNSQEKVQLATKCMKNIQYLYQEMQIKISLRFHFIPEWLSSSRIQKIIIKTQQKIKQ